MDTGDIIEVASPRTSVDQPRPQTDKRPNLIPREEYRYEHLEEQVQKLVEICHARGEIVGEWKWAFVGMIKSSRSEVDYARTWDTLRCVLDRIIRGEFLLFFSEKSGRLDAVNPIFEPQHVIVLKEQRDSTINPARRPAVSSTSKLVLSDLIYFQARLPAPESLSREEFRNAIVAISNAFHKLHSTLAKVAKDWEVSVLTAGKDVGGTRWNLRSSRSRVMRWKLIVVGEKVRTGERLPNVEELLHGQIEPPRNVDPEDACFVHSETAHSLARISLRQARRIGYVGRVSEEGGMHFF